MTTYTAENPLRISVTEILTFKRCRLQWHFTSQLRIAPRSEAPYFYTGRVVHKTLELWQDPAQSIEAVYTGVVAQQLEDVKERYRTNFKCEMSPVEEADILERSYMSYRMVTNYAKRWGKPLPDGFRMIQPEQTFLVAIPGVDNVLLEGTLDALAEEIATGKLFVVEHKTYSARPKLHDLENAEQFVGYCWILTQAFPEREIGGVLYDGLWKREDPPKGRVFNDLFCRERLLKTAVEIAAFERNLTAVAREMVGGPAIYLRGFGKAVTTTKILTSCAKRCTGRRKTCRTSKKSITYRDRRVGSMRKKMNNRFDWDGYPAIEREAPTIDYEAAGVRSLAEVDARIIYAVLIAVSVFWLGVVAIIIAVIWKWL